MNSDKAWPRRIEEAARLLEASPSAPAWLRKVVRDSVALAEILAPDAPRDHRPSDHFYPH